MAADIGFLLTRHEPTPAFLITMLFLIPSLVATPIGHLRDPTADMTKLNDVERRKKMRRVKQRFFLLEIPLYISFLIGIGMGPIGNRWKINTVKNVDSSEVVFVAFAIKTMAVMVSAPCEPRVIVLHALHHHYAHAEIFCLLDVSFLYLEAQFGCNPATTPSRNAGKEERNGAVPSH